MQNKEVARHPSTRPGEDLASGSAPSSRRGPEPDEAFANEILAPIADNEQKLIDAVLIQSSSHQQKVYRAYPPGTTMGHEVDEPSR